MAIAARPVKLEVLWLPQVRPPLALSPASVQELSEQQRSCMVIRVHISIWGSAAVGFQTTCMEVPSLGGCRMTKTSLWCSSGTTQDTMTFCRVRSSDTEVRCAAELRKPTCGSQGQIAETCKYSNIINAIIHICLFFVSFSCIQK